jgi:hypothetical protein
MRRFVWMTLIVCLTIAPVARADADAEAAAVLDKAITALGGAKALGKHKAFTWKSSGQFIAGDMKVTISDEWSISGQDQYRWELEVTFGTMTQKGVLVLTDKEAWAKGGDAKTDKAPADVHTLLRNDLYAAGLAESVLALRGKDYKLSPLGELKIDDKPAVGLKVSRKDYPDVDLFFDKETGLPVRSEVRVKEPMAADEITHAFYYSGYKEFDGRKHFTKITLKRDDKLAMELERKDITGVESLDKKTFEKPE